MRRSKVLTEVKGGFDILEQWPQCFLSMKVSNGLLRTFRDLVL